MIFAADDVMNGYTELFLFSTQRLMDFAILPNIMEGDSLSVKLCTMTEEIYRYWAGYGVEKEKGVKIVRPAAATE